MLCDNAKHLMELVRADSVDAKEVLCADRSDMSWIGFCIVYHGGGTTTHVAALESVKDWDGCPGIGDMLSRADGRKELARTFTDGGPAHEGCDYCLVENVMEA